MKHILILAFCLISFVAVSQTQYRYGITAYDTSSASQTHYIYPGTNTIAGTVKFKEAGDLEVLFQLDSLSGATAGTMTLQFAYSDIAAPRWYDVTTYTYGSGVAGATIIWSSRTQALNFTALKWRIRVVNTSGTQSNKAWAEYTWKRRT